MLVTRIQWQPWMHPKYRFRAPHTPRSGSIKPPGQFIKGLGLIFSLTRNKTNSWGTEPRKEPREGLRRVVHKKDNAHFICLIIAKCSVVIVLVVAVRFESISSSNLVRDLPDQVVPIKRFFGVIIAVVRSNSVPGSIGSVIGYRRRITSCGNHKKRGKVNSAVLNKRSVLGISGVDQAANFDNEKV
jgi:hypothetical protein